MQMGLLNESKELLDYVVAKAYRHSTKRFVVFTKKHLEDTFVVMTGYANAEGAMEWVREQGQRCIDVNPRFDLDQLEERTIIGNNKELLLETMRRIQEK